MKSFIEFLEEKKRNNKGKKEKLPLQPTITSSPIKGPNQDNSGIGVKNDNADYTISDSYIQRD